MNVDDLKLRTMVQSAIYHIHQRDLVGAMYMMLDAKAYAFRLSHAELPRMEKMLNWCKVASEMPKDQWRHPDANNWTTPRVG